ncbi:unnamed protein product [Ostreobium quekettii]|uniref:G-patch domain-containing protein n=1 Tax=Ostreobium quekettii TaxID=121088 RepID=A0A8S1JCD9_9CHLO|nr:unnamed protein product [Ostreobium quekettii]|eukprot:evm.model.scf_282EXC.3 EVM.evm.TU.scf_282EXC.3   scf_282EXC:22789-24903(-)
MGSAPGPPGSSKAALAASAGSQAPSFCRGGVLGSGHEREREVTCRSTETRRGCVASSSQRCGLKADNVGYSLLKKAGWTEGTGLGPDGQGRQVPVKAWVQKGRRGVGCQEPQDVGLDEGPPGASRSGQVPREAKGTALGHQTRLSCAKRKREKEQRREELKRQQREEQHRKATVRRALSHAFDGGTADDTDHNPLLRRNRLSTTNPLLD